METKQDHQVVASVQGMYTEHPFPNTSIVNTFWSHPHREYLKRAGVYQDGGSGLRILEGGCGTGEKLVAHAKTFPRAKLCAIDLTPASIQVANFHVKEFRAHNVEAIKQANLMEPLPFPDESFDVVYSLGVVHHTPKPYLAMQNLGRLVKPGGYLFFWVYGALGQLWRIKKLNYMTLMRKGLPAEETEQVVRDSFKEASFSFNVRDRIRSLSSMKGINFGLLAQSLLVAIKRRRSFNFVGMDDSNLYDGFLHAHEKFYTGEDVVTDTRKSGLFIEDFIVPELTLTGRVNRMSDLMRRQWEKLTPFERLQAVDAITLPNEYWWVCRKSPTPFSKSVPEDYGSTVKIVRTAFDTDQDESR